MFCVPRAKVKIFFPCGALYMVMNELNCMGGLCNIAFIVLPLNKRIPHQAMSLHVGMGT